jgi:hypothetical protein
MAFLTKSQVSALFTENKLPHFIAELLDLFGIGRGSKALCQRKESLFLFFLSFQAQLYQVKQHPVVTEALLFCNPLNLLRESRRQSNTPADLFRRCHFTILHQYGVK